MSSFTHSFLFAFGHGGDHPNYVPESVIITPNIFQQLLADCEFCDDALHSRKSQTAAVGFA